MALQLAGTKHLNRANLGDHDFGRVLLLLEWFKKKKKNETTLLFPCPRLKKCVLGDSKLKPVGAFLPDSLKIGNCFLANILALLLI